MKGSQQMVSEWPCDGDTADLHVLYAGQYLHMTWYGQTRLPPIHTAPPTYIDEKIGRRYLTTPCCRQVVQLFLCCSYTPPTDLDIPWLAHHTPARPPARQQPTVDAPSRVNPSFSAPAFSPLLHHPGKFRAKRIHCTPPPEMHCMCPCMHLPDSPRPHPA
jgi:hypothetical protein